MFRGAEDKRTGARTSATQIEISRMDKEPNFVSYEAKLARTSPIRGALLIKTYLNLKTRECLFSTLTLLQKSECSEKSKLQTIFGYLTALQLLHNGRGCQFPRKSEQRQAKLYT